MSTRDYPQYLASEAPIVTFDLRNAPDAIGAGALLSTQIGSALEHLPEMGIRHVQVRTTDWLAASTVMESICGATSSAVSCHLPMSELPRIVREWTGRSVQLVLLLPSVSELKGHVGECIATIEAALPPPGIEGVRLASVALPVDRDGWQRADELTERLCDGLHVPVILCPMMSPIVRCGGVPGITWQELDALYGRVIDRLRLGHKTGSTLMETGFLPTRLLTEHPCNAYVCDGATCHSGKGDLPRKLVVLYDGAVLPEHCDMNPALAVGSIYDSTISEMLSAFSGSGQHICFKNLARRVFLEWVQVCPFRVVPWAQIMMETSYVSDTDEAAALQECS